MKNEKDAQRLWIPRNYYSMYLFIFYVFINNVKNSSRTWLYFLTGINYLIWLIGSTEYFDCGMYWKTCILILSYPVLLFCRQMGICITQVLNPHFYNSCVESLLVESSMLNLSDFLCFRQEFGQLQGKIQVADASYLGCSLLLVFWGPGNVNGATL